MKIWNLLEHNQKKLFIILFIFNILIVFLELISLSSIFPIIYSLNNDLNLLENNVFFSKIFIFINHREMDYNILNKKISLNAMK